MSVVLPEGTNLPPCTMGAAMWVPGGTRAALRDMVPQQPTPCSHGEPTHVDAQNERVNSRGKPYMCHLHPLVREAATEGRTGR